MSFLTGTSAELIYMSTSPATAKNTFTTEVRINDNAGMGSQACIPPYFWQPTASGSKGRVLYIKAFGLLNITGTPTFTWSLRLGAADTVATDNQVLGSAAITVNVDARQWTYEGWVTMETPGAPGKNSTVRGVGHVIGNFGASSLPIYAPLYGGAASPGTIATVDISITNYINFNAACSASSGSNGITLQSLMVWGLN
jgi:hypothetical protein